MPHRMFQSQWSSGSMTAVREVLGSNHAVVFIVKKHCDLQPWAQAVRTLPAGQLSLVLPRGATTAEKLRGTKVWVSTPGRLRPAPGQRPGWGGCGRGSPLPLWGRGVTHGKFSKTQMLNPAFWWLLRSMVGSRTCISEKTTSMSRAKSVAG